jgi:hypothetical protein
MLFAERHRKLGRHGTTAHDRSEDLLTSTTVQLLRYIPLQEGLLAILSRVRSVLSNGELGATPSWLRFEHVTSAEFECWKRLNRGEPDIVVTFFQEKECLGRIVIEVKLDSMKSSEDVEEIAEAPTSDQLAKYRVGLQAGLPRGLGVIYLTSQATPPVEELAASMRSKPGDWLGWLSWGDVWTSMKRASSLPANDLASILEAKQLNMFNGFEPSMKLGALGDPQFWLS